MVMMMLICDDDDGDGDDGDYDDDGDDLNCQGGRAQLMVHLLPRGAGDPIYIYILYSTIIFILSPRGDQMFFSRPEIQSKLKGRDGKRISTLIHMHFCRRGNGMENL